MSNALAILKTLAQDFPNRADFNKAGAANFRKVGHGAFRIVFDGGDVVIKLRWAAPKRDNKFPMSLINSSNRDEAAAYKKLLKSNPDLATFVLKPTLVKLPNGHDVILMEKVKVWGGMKYNARCKVVDNNTYLHDQIQVIQTAFQDAHDNNVGIKDDRAYLIDFNFASMWGQDESDVEFRNGVLRRMREKNGKPLAMEAAA
jgi:tRNA A-37 threonylcarbamoyl transferase component Bud32